ncbi:MAG: aconitase family protein, partial [Lentisphaeria bacterium]
MGMTITEKILAKAAGKDFIQPGDNIWVNADILLTHDVCGPGTVGVLRREFGADAKPWDVSKVVVIPDHYIYTEDKMCNRNVDFMTSFANEVKLPYYYQPHTDNYKGVCHVALPQEGHVQPGKVIFGTDSHTCSHGAFGAFATGIGNTDAGFVMGTGKLLIKVPSSKKFILKGEMPNYIMAKDIILEIIGTIGVDGATYQAMEFCGDTIDKMAMDERITICNMAIEAGGKNGI